jgi:hypothetical protein
VRSTFVNRDALDQLLLERFGGKAGRGLAVELSRGCDSSRCLEYRGGCNGTA